MVINKGFADGVYTGALCVLYSLGKEIFDPETKTSLGLLENYKGKGVVIHVQENMSTIQHPERPNPILESMMPMSSLLYKSDYKFIDVKDRCRITLIDQSRGSVSKSL